MSTLIDRMKMCEEIFYLNEDCGTGKIPVEFTKADIEDAEARLIRFSKYIEVAFPETKKMGGIIESPLTKIDKMRDFLELENTLYLKEDSMLPISGSVKARGGIYEVLKVAEDIAIKEGLLSYDDDYSIIAEDRFKKLFSTYKISVGSTGNLGLSIGIISAKLGFEVTVHMSADARQWKKDLLTEKGAKVIEYAGDYAKAVEQGRKEAEMDPKCHFVDDENSVDLFLGYSVAGKRLKAQFDEKGIIVDAEHPLCVFLPCGVGGAPGGITFGIKTFFGEHAHIYFAEPVLAPCMTLGLVSGELDQISTRDIGLHSNTIADGLAVYRPSKLVSKICVELLDGAFTVSDDRLMPYLQKLYELENIFIEPSACVSFAGAAPIDAMSKNATLLSWATGGNMVPSYEREKYLTTK